MLTFSLNERNNKAMSKLNNLIQSGILELEVKGNHLTMVIRNEEISTYLTISPNGCLSYADVVE